MPSWSEWSSFAPTGLYAWVCARLEESFAAPDPREMMLGAVPIARRPPAQLERFRSGRPVTVPAWMLDGHRARQAGFVGVVPVDRSVRARSYVVGPDDSVREVDS